MINTCAQIAFYSFERAVHTERKNGELTRDAAREIWLSVQGESLARHRDQAGYENYWMYIPHFIHSPFYVYAYAFAIARESLYAIYEDATEGFAERSRHAAAGGTKHYSQLLRPFGGPPRIPILGWACRSIAGMMTSWRRWAEGRR